MSDISQIEQFIRKTCETHSLILLGINQGKFRIYTEEASGITAFLEIEENKNISFYFLLRTHDVVYCGDRSDAHVVLSLMFASFLKTNFGISCLLFDIPHPAVQDEIWGRYLMPQQSPSFLGSSIHEYQQNAVLEIVSSIASWRTMFWNIMGCPCEKCLKARSIEFSVQHDITEELSGLKEQLFKHPKNYNYSRRIWPNWDYFYNISEEITLIKSLELSQYFEALQIVNTAKEEYVEGINGSLLLNGDLKNFLAHKDIKKLRKLIKGIEKSTKQVNCAPLVLENMILAVSSPYIIAIGRLCGIYEFRVERENTRNRHNRESQLLFPISAFEWEDEVCPDQFEGLIKALLEREPNVKMVRKPAPINQGDKGRDLLIDWNVINPYVISEETPPTSLTKVVGQCKASNKTIGKHKVLDIRDTVETHNAQGYFLAVSTQIAEALTAKLEDLQAKGIWTQWWNRDDIETRLSKNQDLIPLFPKVLKAKDYIKFVEK
ncbi:MAG: restriction endonuclease [Niabella sp.]|nr:restriction endonuclease [Niabella sp.]